MLRTWTAVTLVLGLCLAMTGCPRPTRRTLVPSVPTDGDDAARARFLEARERFLRDGSGAAELADIARDYPDDPIAPFANLYAGIAEVQKGDHKAAVEHLQTVVDDEQADDGMQTRARLFLGIAWNALGEPAKAAPLLERGEAAIENEAERGEWIAASTAAAVVTRPLSSFFWLDKFWAIATDPEKGWILATLDQIVGGASPEEVRTAWTALGRPNGPSGAVLGARMVEILAAGGDPDGAAKVRSSIAAQRQKMGLPALGDDVVGVDDAATPGQFGAVLPLEGKQSRVAEAAARGLAIAAGSHGGASVATIDIADASGADASAAAVDSLAGQGAIAIVGPIDGDSVDGAALRAESLGITLVSLNPRADERPAATRRIFHAMHSAEARARILARRAFALGLTKVAILAPESGYGRAVATAFADELDAIGGKLVVRVDYAADAKSFAKVVKQLDGSWQAVFVPEQADRLELIAPALAAAGLVPRPVGGKVGKKQGRAIVLLSTAEGLSPDYIRDAGRHTVGALLAPGFYPDTADPTIGDFVARYQQANGKLPTAVDAYAHDAALAIAVAAGAEASRAAVTRNLEIVEVEGATGRLRFGKDHRRADDGVVFTVEDDGVTVKTLR